MKLDLLFFTHLINWLFMIAAPLVLGAYLTRRFGLGWRLLWIGGATFIFSQIFHIPFNAGVGYLLTHGILPAPLMPMPKLIFNSIFGGLSAGIFEEGSRYIMYRWWAKEARSWRQGILAGAGHGGAEAILLGVLVLWGFIQMVALRGVEVSTVLPADKVAAAESALQMYWNLPWSITLLGFVERVFSICVHIFLSLLVMQAFTQKKLRWLWLAIGFHAAGDALIPGFAAGLLKGINGYEYILEGLVGLFALLSIAGIFWLRRLGPEAPPEAPSILQAPPPLTSADLLPIEETPENLEKSRYHD